MKFIIFNDYGGFVPDVLIPLMKEHPFPENRYNEDTINYIKKKAVLLGEKDAGYFKKNPDVIAYIPGTNLYYAFSSSKHYLTHFSIVDIDPSVKHYIKEYDGTESICELPHWECIDEKCNMYREKGEHV